MIREIHQWLEKKSNKYTSREIQNSLIKIMAYSVIRKVSENLHKSPFLAVVIDQTTDVTNQEQVTIVIRWIMMILRYMKSLLGVSEHLGH